MITGNATAERVSPFGTLPDGTAVDMHTLTNSSGMEICFINLGGIIGAIKVPDRNGRVGDITPGFDHLHEYLADTHYLGALVGRYANRIADAHFVLDGKPYQLVPNDGPNLLHGGREGFHRAVWNVELFEEAECSGAELHYTSPAGEGGFPGNLDVHVTYRLTKANELVFEYRASCDAPTPVNLTQHTYFNLAGHAAGNIFDHELCLASSRYLPIDDEFIPTGQIEIVDGSPFDFRCPRLVGDALAQGTAAERQFGYDHTFLIDGDSRIVARVAEPTTGRTLEIETTEPGIQLYSGNQFPAGLRGKEGARYGRHCALALETQHFPNSPNVPGFPSTILRPGTQYYSRTVYRFGILT